MPKFLLTMVSIMELDDVMSMSTVSWFSKTSSILEVNVVDIWWIYVRSSNFL